MDTNIPLTALPGLSWPNIIDTIRGTRRDAEDVADFYITQATEFLRTDPENLFIVVAGFDIGDDLVGLAKHTHNVRGIVYNPEFLDDVAVKCIQNKCNIRLYLSSDSESNRLHDIHLLVIPDLTFSQIARDELNALRIFSSWKNMLSAKALIIVEVGTIPTQLAQPQRLTNADESVSTITQKLHYRDPSLMTETLTYEAISEHERLAVHNVRTFRIWTCAELEDILQRSGFTEVRQAEINRKKYVIACKNDFLPQRRTIWDAKY